MAQIKNNSLVDNRGAGASGIWTTSYNSRARYQGNIIYAFEDQVPFFAETSSDLTEPVAVNNVVYTTGTTVFGGAIEDLDGVDGNMFADPLFVNSNLGDYRLLEPSPAIDHGDLALDFDPTDFIGAPRWIDGNLDGVAVVDAGALEFSHVEISAEILGERLCVKVSGPLGYEVLLLIGTSGGSLLCAPFGVVLLDTQSPLIVLVTVAKAPALLSFPLSSQTAIQGIVLQALAVSTEKGVGNLSALIELDALQASD
jgi:hypothetical protein